MPTAVTRAELDDAIAAAAVASGRPRSEAQRAADLLAGWIPEGSASVVLTRYSVAVAAWATLPRKVIAPRDELVELAEAMASVLDALGAGALAAIPRDPVTVALIDAVDEADMPGAAALLGASLRALGIVPPDVAGFTWGEAMGAVEASAFEAATFALDAAIDRGLIAIGEPGAERAAEALVEALLAARSDDGETRLDAILAERQARR